MLAMVGGCANQVSTSVVPSGRATASPAVASATPSTAADLDPAGLAVGL